MLSPVGRGSVRGVVALILHLPLPAILPVTVLLWEELRTLVGPAKPLSAASPVYASRFQGGVHLVLHLPLPDNLPGYVPLVDELRELVGTAKPL